MERTRGAIVFDFVRPERGPAVRPTVRSLQPRRFWTPLTGLRIRSTREGIRRGLLPTVTSLDPQPTFEEALREARAREARRLRAHEIHLDREHMGPEHAVLFRLNPDATEHGSRRN